MAHTLKIAAIVILVVVIVAVAGITLKNNLKPSVTTTTPSIKNTTTAPLSEQNNLKTPLLNNLTSNPVQDYNVTSNQNSSAINTS